MKKTSMLALVAAGALLTAGAAEARVSWSIGIDAPGVATVVSNGPAYRQAPVYVAAPVVYEQAPVVERAPAYAPVPVYAPVPRYAPPPVVRYLPAPVGYYAAPPVYAPAPVVVYPDFRRPGWHGWEHRRDERWEHADRGGDVRWDGRR